MWLARQLQHPGCREHLLSSSRRLLLTSLRLFSPSAGIRYASSRYRKPAHFMVDYLVSSCGLSRAEALRASQPLAHLKSPERPDAVLRLLRQEGLGDAYIKRAVLRLPRMLLVKPKETLEPGIRALREAGFSSSEVAQLISLNPNVVYVRDALHRAEFWRKLVGTNQNLLKAMKADGSLLCYSLDDRVIPRLSLLRSLGVSDDKMGKVVLARPRLVSVKPGRMQNLVEQVKSLGFSPGSGMFVQALFSVANLSRSTFDSKFKLLRSFGWTQAELMSAIRRFPNILSCSEKKIRAVMDFLLNEAGFELSYIARNPILVGFSMEKRLMPRCYVLQSLKTKGLLSGSKGFSTAMQMTEDKFIQKYIVRYSGRLPELLEAYHAVVAKKAKAIVGSL